MLLLPFPLEYLILPLTLLVHNHFSEYALDLVVVWVVLVLHAVDLLGNPQELRGEAGLFCELVKGVLFLLAEDYFVGFLWRITRHAIQVVAPGQVHCLEVDQHVHQVDHVVTAGAAHHPHLLNT